VKVVENDGNAATEVLRSPNLRVAISDWSPDGELLYTVKRAEPAISDRVHVLANWLDPAEPARD
jgi:hypothetical protein